MEQHSLQNVVDVFAFFPNTPLKLLKDVFEALQLYDLVELLEKPVNPLAIRSLRHGISLDEIQKLRNTAGRPISYHSRAAVLIFAKDTQDSSVKGIEAFFKDLNLNCKVTVIQCTTTRWVITAEKEKHEVLLQTTQAAIRKINKQLKTATEHEAIIALERELQSKMETLEGVKKGLKDFLEEDENVLTATLMVIDEWIQCQGEFSFFAVFDVAGFAFFPDVIRKLGSGIPNKTKFVFGSSRERNISEVLEVSNSYPFSMLLEILNKRWQTLDLVSMVQELSRLNYKRLPWSLGRFVQDTLSSLPRFKRAEDFS